MKVIICGDEEDDDEVTPRTKKRVWRNGSDAISYPKQRAEKDYSLRME